jgi:hypothetical protein
MVKIIFTSPACARVSLLQHIKHSRLQDETERQRERERERERGREEEKEE